MNPNINNSLSQSNNSKQSYKFSQAAFSSSVALPKRRRQTDSSVDKAERACTSSESEEENDPSSINCGRSHSELSSKETQEQETKSISPKITSKLSAFHSSRKELSFQKYMFQDSDSLCNRFNPLQSQKRAHQKYQSSNKKRLAESAKSQVVQYIKKECEQQIGKTPQLGNQQSCQIQADKAEQNEGATENTLQKFDKYVCKEQTSYYTEWEEVFGEQKMKELYANYNPVHFQENDIQKIMEAIQKVSQENLCGRVFIQRAYKHYVHNYGRITQQDFETKVVGDMLFLFRKHNEKQERQYHQREQWLKQQEMAKNNKKKF